MKKRKIVTLVCAAMTAATLMTGCSGSTSDEPIQGTVEAEGETQETGTEDAQKMVAEEGQKGEGKPQEAGNRVMGKVTAVNGNEITLALVNMGARPEGGNGERPEMPEGENGERPEMPEGGNGERTERQEGEKTEMPEGERPEGKGGRMSADMMEETGETKTIVIEDESIIVKFEGEEEAAGTLDDIEVDSIISLSYDENETLTQVTIGFGGKR